MMQVAQWWWWAEGLRPDCTKHVVYSRLQAKFDGTSVNYLVSGGLHLLNYSAGLQNSHMNMINISLFCSLSSRYLIPVRIGGASSESWLITYNIASLYV
jgi:hypothetical protein